MKKSILVVIMLAVMLAGSGCGPYFKSQAQYDDKGDWYLLASSREVARIKADRLAFEKLKTAPAQTEVKDGAVQGFKGLVANLSSYNRYNFTLTGPETKSYLLGPGERANDYLIPGTYVCIITQGNYRVGSWAFSVGSQQSVFMNEKYHWYVYTDR